MRSKSLRTLLVSLGLCIAMLSVPTPNIFRLLDSGQYVSTLLAAESMEALPAPVESSATADLAAKDSQADAPIVGLNFRTEGILNANQPVTFVAETTGGTNIRYRWDFGDGSSPQQGATVTHTFSNKGIYNVTLVAENSISIKTATRQIDISKVALPSPVVTISGNRRVNAPLTFRATVNTTARVQVTWDFGDGETSRDNPAAHSYRAIGTFVVTANVVNLDDSTDRSSATELITIVDQPIVGWSRTPIVDPASKKESSQPITFRARVSSGTNVSYRWNFGDGTPVVTTRAQMIVHTYDAPGIFKVTVNAYNSVSNIDNTIDDPLYIEVAPLIEEIDTSPTIECIPTEGLRKIICVSMLDQGEPATYRWNFGDGATALGPIVHHSYAADGKYAVRVVVRNQHPTVYLANRMTTVNIITPEDPVTGLAPSITVNPTPPVKDELAYFILSQKVEGATNYIWDFGDGTDPKVVLGEGSLGAFHTYTELGQYVVTVVAEDASGNVIDFMDVNGASMEAIDAPVLVTEKVRAPFVISR